VQDILNALTYLQTRYARVDLVGLGRAGLWSLLARGLAYGVRRTVVDVDQFGCDSDSEWADGLYIPLLRRAGDLRTAAALIAPGQLFVYNASASFPGPWFRDIYRAAGAENNVRVVPEALKDLEVVGYISGQVSGRDMAC